MTEIKKPISITWTAAGDNQYARLLIPNDVTRESFLIPDIRRVQMTAKVENDRIVIVLEPLER